jgi:hypothetical protein
MVRQEQPGLVCLGREQDQEKEKTYHKEANSRATVPIMDADAPLPLTEVPLDP